MATRKQPAQIAFRYRPTDSAIGVTRETAKRMAKQLGVDETSAIHLALHAFALRVLPQYAQDDGPLTDRQVREIRRRVPQGTKRSIRSTLIGSEK